MLIGFDHVKETLQDKLKEMNEDIEILKIKLSEKKKDKYRLIHNQNEFTRERIQNEYESEIRGLQALSFYYEKVINYVDIIKERGEK